MDKTLPSVTLVARLGAVVGADEIDLASFEPSDVPIVDKDGKVIGRATVDGDGLVWCRTDGATADKVRIGCGPVSIGSSED